MAAYIDVPIDRPVVFPLLPITRDDATGEVRCGCSNPKCKRVGKHPAVEWGELSYGDAVPRPEPGAGVGLKTGAHPKGSDVIVVDLDSEEAEAIFEQLDADELDPPPTYTVKTPRGVHFYFKHPGFKVGNSAGELGKGIDVRGDGGFVVAGGSPHKSGAQYDVINDAPPAPAPGWLVEWLKKKPAPSTVQSYAGDVSDPTERSYRRELYAKYLKTTTPCVQGEAGDDRLFAVVQHGAYDLQLPTEDVLELVAEHFDPRCQPPWGEELEERIKHKAHTAKTGSTRPRAEPMPADLAFLLEPPPLPPPKVKPVKEAGTTDEDGVFWDDWDAPIPPVEWLVTGLIPVATVGMFVAHGSSLKTWTELSIAAAVAKGEPWLGKYLTKQGRTLVVDYESGLYEIRRRIRLLEGGRPVSGLGAWSDNIDLRIDDPAFWKKLAGIPGLTLVWIDSLAAGAPATDENLAAAATPLHLAARYSNETGAAVGFIHHSKKDDTDDRKMVRGTTALYAACDWVYKFEDVEETPEYRRMLMSSTKASMGKKPHPVQLELTDDGLRLYGEDGAGKPLKPKEPDYNAIQEAIKLALTAGPLETPSKIQRAASIADAKLFADELKALMVRNEVIKLPGVGYSLDTPEARRARVLNAVRDSKYWRSEAQIAKAAHVDTDFVLRMVVDGWICKSGDAHGGCFMVVDRG